MKNFLFLLAAILVIGVSTYTVKNYSKSSNVPNSSNTPIQINQNSIKTKAKDFKLKDLNGKEISLSDLKGKKVFLNFWATWCPPCKEEMPEIQKIYQETKNSDLVILTVEIGEPLSEVKSFIHQNKYDFIVLLDSEKSAAEQYGISAIPTSFFIDKEGNIVSKVTGAMNIDQMKEHIRNLDKK